MPLQGTFDVLDFTEVLRLLGRHQLTGRLHVRHRSFGANLFVETGQLSGADQSEHQTAAGSGDVRGRIEEICFEMLEAERGSFEFQPGKASALPVTTRYRVDTVLGQARKRLDEWRRLQERIPSLELQPRLVGDLGQAEVTIDKERWRLLTVIDGRRNLRAIGRILNASDFDICRVLAGLMDDAVVELDGLATLSAATRDAMPTVPGPEPSQPRSGDSESGTTIGIRTSGIRTSPLVVRTPDARPAADAAAAAAAAAAAKSAGPSTNGKVAATRRRAANGATGSRASVSRGSVRRAVADRAAVSPAPVAPDTVSGDAARADADNSDAGADAAGTSGPAGPVDGPDVDLTDAGSSGLDGSESTDVDGEGETEDIVAQVFGRAHHPGEDDRHDDDVAGDDLAGGDRGSGPDDAKRGRLVRIRSRHARPEAG